MNRVSTHVMPKGPVNSIRLVTDGQISKQNLMNAFLKNPSSPRAVGTEGKGWVRGKGVEA